LEREILKKTDCKNVEFYYNPAAFKRLWIFICGKNSPLASLKGKFEL
jgi:hypothetical protein